MIGVALNGALMLVGGMLGRWSRWDPAAGIEARLRPWLGLFTLFAAGAAFWSGVSDASFGGVLLRLLLLFIGLTLGRAAGAVLGVQRAWNRMGGFARQALQRHAEGKATDFNDAFLAVTTIGCLSPLAMAGPILAGATGDLKPLCLKAVLDGLAMVSFARHLGWGTLLAILPVVVLQGVLFLVTRWLLPWLSDREMVAGLVLVSAYFVLGATLVVFGVHRVRLADYLPAVLVTPVLFLLWGLA